MQPLPNIEVLSFLNWMDIHGHARNRVGVPMEELFLSDEFRDLVLDLEAEYMFSRRDTPKSENAAYEQYVDNFLAELKRRILKEFRAQPLPPSIFRSARGYGQNTRDMFVSSLERVIQNLDRTTLRDLAGQLDPTPINMFHYRKGDLSESVRVYMQHCKDSAVFNYFLRRSDSVAKTTLQFLEWVKNEGTLLHTSLRNVPATVMEAYIHDYIWSEYQRNGLSAQSNGKKEALLRRVLIEQKYSDYLKNILMYADPEDYTLNAVARRSFGRYARYKCTLLAEDNSFRSLVHDHWEEMNSCSGDHLDIYYSEAELEQRGRATADKLHIRSRVSSYPAIYIWEYRLDAGFCIPVRGLDSHALMDLFRMITDDIAKGHELRAVVESANQAVDHILKNTAMIYEENFTKALLDACAKLQTNENWVRNTDENGRNAYIKDLLETAGYRVSDQTLSGLSPTGKSAGELDLKVFTPDGQPFTILEALNITAKLPLSWDKEILRTHVNKLYRYDANGLARNYVIVYATAPLFGRFTNEVYQLLSSSTDCPYGNAELIDVVPMDTGCTDLSLACARYLRSGSEIRLYILCVRMSNKKSAIPETT